MLFLIALYVSSDADEWAGVLRDNECHSFFLFDRNSITGLLYRFSKYKQFTLFPRAEFTIICKMTQVKISLKLVPHAWGQGSDGLPHGHRGGCFSLPMSLCWWLRDGKSQTVNPSATFGSFCRNVASIIERFGLGQEPKPSTCAAVGELTVGVGWGGSRTTT